MKNVLRYRFFGIFLASLFLSACADMPDESTSQALQSTASAHAITTKIAARHTAPVVVMHQGYYVDTMPIHPVQMPKWLRRPVDIEAKELPFAILVNRILMGTGMIANFDQSVVPQQLVSLTYRGNVAGVLKRLEALTHDTYQVSGNQLLWSGFVTKTFDIAFMPGNFGGWPGATQVPVSLWHDLSDTLNTLKSETGHVIVSEATTSVTVHDRPENVAAMAQYIKRLNHSLSQEVGIRVQVIEVALKPQFQFGIAWNVVRQELHQQAITMDDFQLNDSSDDAQADLLTALGREGQVRVLTKPQVIAMNNQVASIRIATETGYLRTVLQSQHNQQDTTMVTPGAVHAGLTLYLLPKIHGDKVYLQISSQIANLMALHKVNNVPQRIANGTMPSLNTAEYSAIQVPTVASKTFAQRSVVKSGNTLIIAGYQPLQHLQNQHVETVVLITPTILRELG